MDDAARENRWRAWMLAARAGDESAYRDLLADVALRLRMTLVRRYGGGAGLTFEVEDIVQETLLALHLKRHTWVAGEKVGPWVAAIARHKAIDALRRRGRRAESPLDELDLADPESDASADENGRDLEQLLGELGERPRAIVRAVSLEGLSTREAATRLSMTEGALRVALHRALRFLAARVRAEEGS